MGVYSLGFGYLGVYAVGLPISHLEPYALGGLWGSTRRGCTVSGPRVVRVLRATDLEWYSLGVYTRGVYNLRLYTVWLRILDLDMQLRVLRVTF